MYYWLCYIHSVLCSYESYINTVGKRRMQIIYANIKRCSMLHCSVSQTLRPLTKQAHCEIPIPYWILNRSFVHSLLSNKKYAIQFNSYLYNRPVLVLDYDH